MFDSVDARGMQVRTFRFSVWDNKRFLQTQEFDSKSAVEMENFLSSHGTPHLLQELRELRDAPFRPKPRLNKTGGTRFSDGSFPVFYSSLEVETAEAEIKHWFPRRFEVSLDGPRTAFYTRFYCEFSGTTKDLRLSGTDCSELIDEDYRFCQQLGAKAVAAGLDGFLTPSARRARGTNLPVFNRMALGLPTIEARVAVTLDPATGDVSMQDA